MRILVQIVDGASVSVESKLISQINFGYVLYLSFTHRDTKETIQKAVDKISKLRIFPDDNGKTNLNIFDVEGEILSISQFTLYADAEGSNRPSFSQSMAGSLAEEYYLYFNQLLREKELVVKEGIFGAHMQIKQNNDGPFSLMLEF